MTDDDKGLLIILVIDIIFIGVLLLGSDVRVRFARHAYLQCVADQRWYPQLDCTEEKDHYYAISND